MFKRILLCAFTLGTAFSQASAASLTFQLQDWTQGATKAVMGVVGLPEVQTVQVDSKGKATMLLPTPKADASGTYLFSGIADSTSKLNMFFALACPAVSKQASISDPKMPMFVGDTTGFVKGKKGFIALNGRMVNSPFAEDKAFDSVATTLIYLPRTATYKADIKDCGKDGMVKSLKADLKLAAGWNQIVMDSKSDSNMNMAMTLRVVPLDKPYLYNAFGDSVATKDMPDAFAKAAKALK